MEGSLQAPSWKDGDCPAGLRRCPAACSWIDSPLKPCTSRLLHIGDSAGNRSALSFAGGQPFKQRHAKYGAVAAAFACSRLGSCAAADLQGCACKGQLLS